MNIMIIVMKITTNDDENDTNINNKRVTMMMIMTMMIARIIIMPVYNYNETIHETHDNNQQHRDNIHDNDINSKNSDKIKKRSEIFKL